MSSSGDSDIDSLLDTVTVARPGFDRSGTEQSDGTSRQVGWKEPGYSGTIDYRIRQLSYSSLLSLHTCPRKFQLYKLKSTHRTEQSETSTITFAYGHAIGTAIQHILENRSEQEVIWQMFLNWNPELFVEDEKANKSFWSALMSVKKFLSLRASGFLQEYELVWYKGKPACELSFAISFPDGFRLRGFVDAVLRHKVSGEILVLECKTTGSKTVSPTQFKNSAQAIGYSIVLDSIFRDLSSYKVLYLVNQSHSGEFTPILFIKTYLQRALWIRELLLDIEMIKLYEDAQVYPMHGESCYSFFKDCEYLATCTLSTEYQTSPCTEEEEDKTEYQVTLTLADLLDTQLRKTEAGTLEPEGFVDQSTEKDELL